MSCGSGSARDPRAAGLVRASCVPGQLSAPSAPPGAFSGAQATPVVSGFLSFSAASSPRSPPSMLPAPLPLPSPSPTRASLDFHPAPLSLRPTCWETGPGGSQFSAVCEVAEPAPTFPGPGSASASIFPDRRVSRVALASRGQDPGTPAARPREPPLPVWRGSSGHAAPVRSHLPLRAAGSASCPCPHVAG